MTEIAFDRDQALQILRKEGVSNATLARAFGLSRQRVSVILGPTETEIKAPPAFIDTPDAEQLPTALKAWRTRRELTQRDAAVLLGVDFMSVSGWETGRKTCSLATLLMRYMAITDMIDGMS